MRNSHPSIAYPRPVVVSDGPTFRRSRHEMNRLRGLLHFRWDTGPASLHVEIILFQGKGLLVSALRNAWPAARQVIPRVFPRSSIIYFPSYILISAFPSAIFFPTHLTSYGRQLCCMQLVCIITRRNGLSYSRHYTSSIHSTLWFLGLCQ